MREFRILYTNDVRIAIEDKDFVEAGLDPKTRNKKELHKFLQQTLDRISDFGTIVKVEEI